MNFKILRLYAICCIKARPFYSYTFGDSTSVYRVLNIANPSLPFCVILEKLQNNNAILAIAPKSSSDSGSVSQAQSLRN